MERRLKKYLEGGQFNHVPAVRSRTMGAIRGRNNKTTEKALRMAFVRARQSGWVLHAPLPGRPDFLFSKKKIVVFVDGCFWHGCRKCGHIPKTRSAFWKAKLNRNKQRDKIVTIELERLGLKVVRVWEHELKNITELMPRLLNSLGI